jgi:hypothetical protein
MREVARVTVNAIRVTMREVARVTVNAIRVYTTHPNPDERRRVAQDFVARFPILATPGANGW